MKIINTYVVRRYNFYVKLHECEGGFWFFERQTKKEFLEIANISDAEAKQLIQWMKENNGYV